MWLNKYTSCSELEYEICWKIHQINNIVFVYNHFDNILKYALQAPRVPDYVSIYIIQITVKIYTIHCANEISDI